MPPAVGGNDNAASFELAQRLVGQVIEARRWTAKDHEKIAPLFYGLHTDQKIEILKRVGAAVDSAPPRPRKRRLALRRSGPSPQGSRASALAPRGGSRAALGVGLSKRAARTVSRSRPRASSLERASCY